MAEEKPTSSSIQIESNRVAFEMSDGKILKLPAGYGTIHDPDGTLLPKCDVFFGPFKKTGRKAEMTRSQRRYFGSDYKAKLATLPNIPREGWKPLKTKVVQIFYVRRGTRAPGGFHHPFKRGLTLSKNGRLYKLSAGAGCLIDDRGYVYP
jgi:hypothetical protein